MVFLGQGMFRRLQLKMWPPARLPDVSVRFQVQWVGIIRLPRTEPGERRRQVTASRVFVHPEQALEVLAVPKFRSEDIPPSAVPMIGRSSMPRTKKCSSIAQWSRVRKFFHNSVPGSVVDKTRRPRQSLQECGVRNPKSELQAWSGEAHPTGLPTKWVQTNVFPSLPVDTALDLIGLCLGRHHKHARSMEH